ncbi:Hypothetical predicted protein [Mytilus galloprovincialis]|uniref:Uncharacterized protein n=1 Tax=Mytilus galloprovincialis TaxID=29158 RepID=A0A8B6GGS4_MYTGA|nr:Hypothetical predicted protein [Mytilus galloprovincialis]
MLIPSSLSFFLPKEPAEIPTIHGPMIGGCIDIPSALNIANSSVTVEEMRLGSKSDLLFQLERFTVLQEDVPNADLLVLDGTAIIYMLYDYFNDIVMPYIHDQLRFVSRLGVVWDEFFSNSLTTSTRRKRGEGVRRRVLSNSRVPGN